MVWEKLPAGRPVLSIAWDGAALGLAGSPQRPRYPPVRAREQRGRVPPLSLGKQSLRWEEIPSGVVGVPALGSALRACALQPGRAWGPFVQRKQSLAREKIPWRAWPSRPGGSALRACALQPGRVWGPSDAPSCPNAQHAFSLPAIMTKNHWTLGRRDRRWPRCARGSCLRWSNLHLRHAGAGG
jgi:hypothetical protein